MLKSKMLLGVTTTGAGGPGAVPDFIFDFRAAARRPSPVEDAIAR